MGWFIYSFIHGAIDWLIGGCDEYFSSTSKGTLSPTDSTSLTELASLDHARQSGTGSKYKKKKQAPKRKAATIKDSYPDYLQEAFFGRGALDDGTDRDQEVVSERLSLAVNIEQPPTVAKATSKNQATANSTDSKQDVKLDGASTSSSHPTKTSKVTSIPTLDISMGDEGDEDDDFAGFGEGDDGALDLLADDFQEDELLNMILDTTEQDDEAPVADEESASSSTARPVKESENDDAVYGPLFDLENTSDLPLPQISSEDAEGVFNDVVFNDLLLATPSHGRHFSNGDGGAHGVLLNGPTAVRSSLSMTLSAMGANDHSQSGLWPGQFGRLIVRLVAQ